MITKNLSEKTNKKALPELEAVILTQILAYLKMRQIRHWRNVVQGTLRMLGPNRAVMTPSTRPGASDIEGHLPSGRYFAIEVKRPGWKPPKEPASLRGNEKWAHYCRQRQWIIDTIKHGGIGIFATSLDEVIQALGL